MKAKQDRKIAKVAVTGADVDVDLSAPESREAETISADRRIHQTPFPISVKDETALALRTRKEGTRPAKGTTIPTLSPSPDINALTFAIRYLPGGRKRFLEFVKLAALNGDPTAEVWWKVFADLTPKQRRACNFDDVASAAGVKPSALLAAIVGHGMEAATDVGNLIAAALHPSVVAAAGKSALRIEGEHASIAAEDRKQLLQARGMLPVPKGTSIHLHANASANAQAASASAAEPSVPKFSDDMDAIAGSHPVIEAALEP